MNWEQVKGLAERIVYIAIIWAQGMGWIPPELVQELVAGIVTIFGVFWSLWVNRQTALVVAAASMPDVKKVVVTSASDLETVSKPGATVSTT